MNIEAMKQALEALEFDGFTPEDATHRRLHGKAITSLRTAIEQALTQGEPVKDRLDFWALFDENQRLRAELKFNSAPQPQREQTEKSELEKDAASLLFALQDAWPYVHARCTIDSVKNNIQKLMRKHGDFAEIHKEIEANLKEKNT